MRSPRLRYDISGICTWYRTLPEVRNGAVYHVYRTKPRTNPPVAYAGRHDGHDDVEGQLHSPPGVGHMAKGKQRFKNDTW